MMKLAKVRHRVMAAIVDFGIVFGVLVLLALWKLPFIISMLKQGEHLVTTKFIVDMFRWGILYGLLLMFYYMVTPLLFNGQTLGKKAFKLKIVKENGEEVDYKTMFFREVIGRIFIGFGSLAITAIASTIIMILRDDNKDLADIIAKTKVIDLYESEEL